MSEIPKLVTMSAQDIIDGLRDDDGEVRAAALSALFPDGNGAILMHVVDTDRSVVTATQKCHPGLCFNTLLFVAQQFGKSFGLQLAWVPEPEDPTKIVVPGMAGPMRPMR